MGFQTIIGRMFIKVDETRFIPMVLGKDSNSFDAITGKATRSYYNLQHISNGYTTIEETKREFMDIAERYKRTSDEYTLEQIINELGWFSTFYVNSNRSMSFNQIIRWFENGFKEALTIEEYKAIGVNFPMYIDGKLSKYLETTQELLEVLETETKRISYWGMGGEDKIERFMQYKREMKNSQSKQPTKQPKSVYVVKSFFGEYVFKPYRSRKYFLTSCLNSAKKYTTKKAAENATKRLYGSFEIVKIDNPKLKVD